MWVSWKELYWYWPVTQLYHSAERYLLIRISSQGSCKRYTIPIYVVAYGGNIVAENGCNSCFIKTIPKQSMWKLAVAKILTLRRVSPTLCDYVVHSEVVNSVAIRIRRRRCSFVCVVRGFAFSAGIYGRHVLNRCSSHLPHRCLEILWTSRLLSIRELLQEGNDSPSLFARMELYSF